MSCEIYSKLIFENLTITTDITVSIYDIREYWQTSLVRIFESLFMRISIFKADKVFLIGIFEIFSNQIFKQFFNLIN